MTVGSKVGCDAVELKLELELELGVEEELSLSVLDSSTKVGLGISVDVRNAARLVRASAGTGKVKVDDRSEK